MLPVMTGRRILPDVSTLTHWSDDEGLTHAQIAARVSAQTGEPVSRSTVSASLSRADKTAQGIRYDNELPWRVKVAHIKEYPARMLRLLGRRTSGRVLSEDDKNRLESWLTKMEQDRAVVAYDPESLHGFHYVTKAEGDGLDGIPIRIPRAPAPVHGQE